VNANTHFYDMEVEENEIDSRETIASPDAIWMRHQTSAYGQREQWNSTIVQAVALADKKKDRQLELSRIIGNYSVEIFHFAQVRNANNAEILDAFLPIQMAAKERSTLTSCDFNPLSFFSIGETTHSKILAYLLNPKQSHGQGEKLLQLFLEQVGIADRSGPWIVTAETGRIDVLIKRTRHPHAAILIENKCHNAVDQRNQLYRYWYQEIFLPNKDRYPTGNLPDPRERYRILYVPADGYKSPEPHALHRCADLPDTLPNTVPAGIVEYLTFYKDIRHWLNACIEALPKENHRLRQFLEQYSELWTY